MSVREDTGLEVREDNNNTTQNAQIYHTYDQPTIAELENERREWDL